jgi:2-methylisocitrate lyase-like PEP mutase family enzyme
MNTEAATIKARTSLKARLAQSEAVLAPGAYDALSALLIEQAGFEAAYLSGASIAYTQLGRPDIGLLGLTQVADVTARVRDRVSIALIVDADTGFGNALNVQHTVRTLERAGATAIQLEDQTAPKRCGHLAGKALISASDMAGKVKAAVDARESEETLVIARTDAIAVEGFERALERAALYRDAGADVLFVEAPQDLAQMQRLGRAFPDVAMLANMVEGGKTPLMTKDQLQALGFRLVISPGSLVRAYAFMAQEFLRQLHQNGTTSVARDRMLDFKQINALLGLQELMVAGEAYEGLREKAAE